MTIQDMADACTTRIQYRDICREIGTDPCTEETAILSVGSEFLPVFARLVRDDGEPTAEYWEWLAKQTVTAQEDHETGEALNSTYV